MKHYGCGYGHGHGSRKCGYGTGGGDFFSDRGHNWYNDRCEFPGYDLKYGSGYGDPWRRDVYAAPVLPGGIDEDGG